jgi:assimilatory nitrate reductase catalytic subunit
MSEFDVGSLVRTACPYCGVGCGVLAKRTASGIEVSGDPDHPANFGRLCSKGSALGDTLSLDGRLLKPSIRGEEVSWDRALDHVAGEFKRIIDAHGPDSVALYVSGQILTEDYYAANKFMKGYVGSANIDTNSRLCMSSAVAGHKRAFGEDIVPVDYDDLSKADLVVLVGSNTAWCHPVVFQRIVKAKEERPEMKVVVVDPRRTATCESADMHLPIKAGTDVWLFNGLLSFLNRHGVVDTAFVSAHTKDSAHALVVADNTAGDVNAVAKQCGIDPQLLSEFYRLFALTPKAITMFSQGVNQSSSGTDKVNSIINCHLLTGRIGKPGMGPFSITGQPNAMGGREVGGLANMLAAHMDLGSAEHRRIVQTFWESPKIASEQGLKAVELFDAIHERRVKAVWIIATNPLVSLPDADKAREALERCELVVVSDCVARTDTTAYAHVLLPALAWGEKDGTVTNSERRISRQRAFLDTPGEAKPDWWIVSQVAKKMGFGAAFAYESAHDVFAEHARLSAFENNGKRAFDIGGVEALSREQFDALEPFQWPSTKQGGDRKLFSDGRYYHPDGRAHFIATTPRKPAHALDEEFPFVLNTGRIRDQWHTMTRTGKAAKLASHLPEPYVDMHPQDVLLCGVRAGDLVRVTTRWGSIVVRLRTSGEMPRRMIFVPIHWNAINSSDARVGALVNPIVDPISGEPEFKHTPARVEPFIVSWYGFALSRQPLTMSDAAWWTEIRGEQFFRYELAGRRVHGDRSQWARKILGGIGEDADWLDFADANAGTFRAAHIVNDKIAACLFISPRPDLPSRSWLASLFARDKLDDVDRTGLLAGQSANPAADTGSTVCSCFGVGRKTICAAITQHALTTHAQIGQHLKAGTNCGSCIPELRAILAEQRYEEGAA